jgi:signal transduction histidine kinase
MNAVLNEVLIDLELLIREKEAIITSDSLPVMDVVPGQMRQVFQNLISNALKFSRSNVAPQIRVACERVEACAPDAQPNKNGSFCSIHIIDNGIGFDDQYSTKIFTIFQRLHSRDQYEGTGIGLAITKKIIEKHNGLIYARSREGAGTTFTLILPVHQHQNDNQLVPAEHFRMQSTH